jgi:phenylacetate-CoA ligase
VSVSAEAAFVAALEQTQYLPPDKLQTYQRRSLEVLLRHARAETEHYPERLAALFRPDDTIDWDRWTDLPVLTRSDVRDGFDALKAQQVPPVAGKVVTDSSSGSTGQPLRFLVTQLQLLASDCCSERFYRWHNLDRAKLTARIRSTGPDPAPYPEGRVIQPSRMGAGESKAIDLSVATPVELQIAWLQNLKPAYLFSYPSNLREIARVGRARGVTLDLAAILTVGEMVSEDTREALRDYFGSAPLDRYGSAEVGQMAAMCPHSGKHHVGAEMVLIEILDDDDKPVPAGTAGRIVATPFYNLAMPLIRYDTGDYGALSAEPCGCGRSLPTLERILGRTRNIFRFADGTSVWPLMESSRMRAFLQARQFQVVQVALDRIEYRYVPEVPGAPVDVAGLTAFARERLHPSINVDVVAVERIERSAGGKYEDYVSLVAAA